MQPPETADGTLLAAEAGRYLAVVEAFRGEGNEPQWEAEGTRSAQHAASPSVPRVVAQNSERRNRC